MKTHIELKEDTGLVRGGHFINMLGLKELSVVGWPKRGSPEYRETVIHFRWDEVHLLSDPTPHTIEYCAFCNRRQ